MSPDDPTAAQGARPGAVIAVAAACAAIITSGIQGVAPAIPAIQAHFGLSEAEVGLITGVYLLPGVFSALAAGLLADRYGVRPVFAGALAVFGLGGVVLLFEHTFAFLLAVRFVQGMAFGAVLSVSVAIIGSVAPSGPRAARAQGQRIIAMAGAEAVFPVVAGLVLPLAWYAPFALQVLALPAAVVAWLVLPSVRPTRAVTGARAGARALWESPSFIGVQTLGALRFIFKFAVLTYFPVLAVNRLGMSAAVLGAVLGAASIISATMAWLTKRLAGRWSSSQLIAGCLGVLVLSLSGMALATTSVVVTIAMLLFGVQDGVYGVAHNVLVTELAPPALRTTYVGVTGTVRNVGKFVAPVLFGTATVVLSLSQSFLALAAVAAVSITATRGVIRVQRERAERRG